mgnify:CR=1 FL=1
MFLKKLSILLLEEYEEYSYIIKFYTKKGKKIMKTRWKSLLMVVLVCGLLVGCGDTVVNSVNPTELSDVKKESEIEELEIKESETEVVEAVKKDEPILYSVYSSSLENRMAEFFLQQATDILKCGSATDHLLGAPISLSAMSRRPHVVYDWDDANFKDALKQTSATLGRGINLRSGKYYNLSVKCTVIDSNMPGTFFNYYKDTDAILTVLYKYEIESTVQHDSSLSGNSYGYVLVSHEYLPSSDEWCYSAMLTVQEKDIDKLKWDSVMLVHENIQKELDELNNSNLSNPVKKAYLDYVIKEFKEVEFEFNVYDIDDDGIEEILYFGPYSAAGVGILGYHDGEVIDNHFEFGSIDIFEEKNKFILSYGRMGYYGDRIYHLENGEAIVDIQGEWYELRQEEENIEDVSYEYEIDGKSVSQDEYEKFFEEAMAKSIDLGVSIDTNQLIDFLSNGKNYSNENISTNDYILQDSAVKELTEADLEGLSAKSLTYARNEIYARHGYIFSSTELNNYFSTKDWYIPNSSFDGTLSDLEQRNADLIRSYQNSNNLDYKPE